MQSSFVVRAALGVALVTLASVPAVAQKPKTGSTLSFSGTATALDVGAAGVKLTFDPTAVGQTVPDFPLTPAKQSGSFAGLDGQGVALGTITVGAGAQYRPNVLTVGGYTFTLTEVPSGLFGQADCGQLDQVTPAVGQTCSPFQSPSTTISPFMLANIPSGDPNAPIASLATFRVVGTVTGPRGKGTASFEGLISTLFPMSFQDALFGLEVASGAYDAEGNYDPEGYGTGEGIPLLPYTATFVVSGNAPGFVVADDDEVGVTVNPEPGTVALAGLGLAAVAGVARARRRRAA